jgi:predicted alpha/beta superfamily hydrolase
MVKYFEKWCPQLDRAVPIHLHLPDDYEENVQERYPVLYMFDGQNLFFDSAATFGKSWGLEDFLNSYEKPLIVVGMECDHRGDNRLQEYMPYAVDAFFGPAAGKGSSFMEWVVDDLKPYIDLFFRTWPHRQATAIAGSSMGGLMAMFAVCRYNTVFSKAACLSPSFQVCPEQISEEVYAGEIDPDTRIYFSFGRKELSVTKSIVAQRYLQEISAYLNDLGCRTLVRLFQNGRHNEESWQMQNSIYMDFLWMNPSWYKE